MTIRPKATETSASSPGAAAQREGDALGFDLPEPARVSTGRFALVGTAVVLGLAAMFLVSWVPRRHARAELERAAKESGTLVRRVEVVKPRTLSSDRELSLPGTVKPLEETVIYSRANGYVRTWNADIGDKVKEGDVLAEVETPELDQEIAQGKAQLAQAEAGIAQATANQNFSKATLDRYTKLVASGVATQQDLDQKTAQANVDAANLDVAKAMVGTQRANLGRLAQLKSFAKITAPFSGTIVARTVERGALVAAGTAPLFRLAALDPVRVFLDVPQDLAPGVRPDLPATVHVREYPGRTFKGTVSHTAGALSPDSRTLSTEVRVPNGDGALLAGMYAEVALAVTAPHAVQEIPAAAVTIDAQGSRVAVVDKEGTVHLAPVVIERDLGAMVDIAKGITADENVVKVASADLVDGAHVEIAASSGKPASSAAP